MSISVGGINLVEAVINLEYELNRTQRILEWVLNNNKIQAPNASAMATIDREAADQLTRKYPSAGIQRKTG